MCISTSLNAQDKAEEVLMENQEKTFTQAEVDSIVSDRVKREQTKHTAEIETKLLTILTS